MLLNDRERAEAVADVARLILSSGQSARVLRVVPGERLYGRTNMLDHPEVTRLTDEMGYPEVAEWLADHRREYAAFVLEGTRPLGKNFGGKDDPAPCADK